MDSVFDPEQQQSRQDSKIVAALERINQAFRVLLWKQAQQHSLSPIQIQIIVFLATHDRSQAHVGQLAREFGITAATVSDAVTTLVAKNFLTRASSHQDRRSTDLKLTASGKRLAKKLAGWSEPLRVAVATMPLADQETAMLFMMKLIESLQGEGVVTVARMCLTCQHFGAGVHPDTIAPHHCQVFDKPLAIGDLRIDCADYEKRH